MTEFTTLEQPVFTIANVILIVLFLLIVYGFWKKGAKSMIADLAKTVIHIVVTIGGTVFLTKRIKLLPEKGFHSFIASYGDFSYEETEKLRVMMSGVIWFLILLVAVGTILGIIGRKLRGFSKDTEKKPVGPVNRAAGGILGVLLCMLYASLAAPIMISAERTGLITNGTDLIRKTVLTIPVNYVAKPLINLIAPDSFAARLYEDGFEVLIDPVTQPGQAPEEENEQSETQTEAEVNE